MGIILVVMLWCIIGAKTQHLWGPVVHRITSRPFNR